MNEDDVKKLIKEYLKNNLQVEVDYNSNMSEEWKTLIVSLENEIIQKHEFDYRSYEDC